MIILAESEFHYYGLMLLLQLLELCLGKDVGHLVLCKTVSKILYQSFN